MRNLAPARIVPGPRFNVFSGDNGQGKTNLIEAVYVVATLRSFRTSRLPDLIAKGQSHARVSSLVCRDELERRYDVTIDATRRSVTLDGKTPRPLAKYFGGFNVVLFAPEDLSVAKGSPAERRRFLDRAVFARDASYLAVAQTYEKVLRSRNSLLRDASEGKRQALDVLPVYDQQIIPLAIAVVKARRAFLESLIPRFQSAFEAITRTGMDVGLDYVTAPELLDCNEDSVAAALARNLPRDLARGTSSFGPHRDDLMFRLAGEPVSVYASQGQNRSIILAWKTAEMELLHDAHRDPPILLLDDVSSELDEARNQYLFSYLSEKPFQTFVTTTHPRHVLLNQERVDYSVQSGTFYPTNSNN